ncbi:SET domain-containing protein [Microstroma glucosiphilum]|uniref:SET domain-containing protein n=1 Tax=Pseudomicrostroma glucosiphilum TaxID=1684307 RepID=A0A316UKM6_9BASI|nr:SET domain-containing protein [Pseudomicrostroma glucosiphilum]PWN23785.1 SET domain-containing protein [Pseudomicrostroma glucosiphilum]
MSPSLPHTFGDEASVPPPGSGLQAELIQDGATRAFLASFLQAGGTFSPLISLTSLESQGNCCVANNDIEEGKELFSIPREILFNTTTCELGNLCRQQERGTGSEGAAQEGGDEAKGDNDMSLDEPESQQTWRTEGSKRWEELTGWTPLILSLMWASVQISSSSSSNASSSKSSTNALWASYFSVMPTDFSHLPMFWPQQDLAELQGTSIPERIGKDEADEEYRANVIPFIKARPGIFFPGGDAYTEAQVDGELQKLYSLERFHIQGSRILSRSFHVKREGTKEVNEGRMVDMDESAEAGAGDSEDSDDEDDEEEKEDTGDISMVPMADMLNASYDSENARLFYTPTSLSMRAVCSIKRGEQILNTYGDPPNSDLLRRYGHVDLINGADEIELSAKLLVEGALKLQSNDQSTPLETRRQALTKRVEHCIANAGLEESYVLSYVFPPTPRGPLPSQIEALSDEDLSTAIEEGRCNFFEDEELQSLCRSLLMDDDEWCAKYEEKGKVPKGKMSLDVAELLRVSCDLREEMYPSATTSSQKGEAPASLNARNARVVREGEKQVLRENRQVLERWMAMQLQRKEVKASGGGKDGKKRKEKSSVSGSGNGNKRSGEEDAGKRRKR